MKDPETTVGHQSKQLETKLLGIEENLEITVDTKQVSKQWHCTPYRTLRQQLAISQNS